MIRNRISIIIFSAIILAALSLGDLSWAAVNYGTTTYFSGTEDELPPVSEPILDAGGERPNWNPDQKDDSDNDDEDDNGGLFDSIVETFDSLFGNSNSGFGTGSAEDDSEKSSLFDFQKSGYESDVADGGSGEYIMGPRGESLEGMSDEEAARYKSRLAQGFNFGNQGKEAVPKKSRLLFTNVEIPLDLTTQYVLLGIVFFVAIGAAVGYYLWKKETAKENMKYNRDEE